MEEMLKPNAQPKNIPRSGVPSSFDNQAGRTQNLVVSEEDMLFGDFINPPWWKINQVLSAILMSI